MILYLDTSALVKLYIEEAGSLDTVDIVDRAELVGTSLFARPETAAACARALKLGLIAEADDLRDQLSIDWPSYVRIAIGEPIITRAESLAWSQHLRAADALHLASALTWSEQLGLSVTLATFDGALWKASHRAGLEVWPHHEASLPTRDRIKSRRNRRPTRGSTKRPHRGA